MNDCRKGQTSLFCPQCGQALGGNGAPRRYIDLIALIVWAGRTRRLLQNMEDHPTRDYRPEIGGSLQQFDCEVLDEELIDPGVVNLRLELLRFLEK